jgi:hypothetical protein
MSVVSFKVRGSRRSVAMIGMDMRVGARRLYDANVMILK